MTYEKRVDGRKFDETREIEAKVGVIKRADGSAMFRIGKTVALAAVYGPRSLHPKFMQNPQKGILRCHYNMLPFSGCGDRIRRRHRADNLLRREVHNVVDSRDRNGWVRSILSASAPAARSEGQKTHNQTSIQ